MKRRKPDFAIGIDFGGTVVKMGLVNRRGIVTEKTEFTTKKACNRKAWLNNVQAGVEQFRKKSRSIAGIGVGVPGFANYDRGRIYNLTNVPGWTNVPLAKILETRFGLSAVIDNDVNAMAIGECTYGAGKHCRHAFFATLGTGVGGAVVINGNIYRGAYSMAGEIGHVSIRMNGHKTREGRGGLETYIGIGPITKYAVKLLRKNRKSLIWRLAGEDLTRVTPRVIAKAAARKDPLAIHVFNMIAECLATAFASVTYLLQPEVFIVGGGVAQSGKVLFNPLRKCLQNRLNPFFADRIKVIPAILGNEAGVIGCAALVFKSFK